MMDVGRIEGAMKGDRIVFLSADQGSDIGSDTLSGLATGDETVICISVTKSAMERKQELADLGVADENVFFIDGSTVEDDEVREQNVVFVNPSNLTGLSIALTNAVDTLRQEGPIVVMLDTIEALGLYSDEESFRRFIHAFCTKMRQYGVPVLLLGAGAALDEEMRSLVQQFADVTVEA